MNLVDAIAVEMEIAAAETINEMLAEIYEQSQVEVPKSGGERSTERFGGTLAESGEYPGNNKELAAIPGKLIGSVVYTAPYAAAQHEGHMAYHRNDKEINWAVHNYTTSGTKSHFLSDPLKALLPQFELRLTRRIQERLRYLFAGGIIGSDVALAQHEMETTEAKQLALEEKRVIMMPVSQYMGEDV